MTETMQSYMQATEKVLAQLKTMAAAEQEKRQALLRHELERLESLLQEQQAMAMKLDGLEKRRYAAQAAAGFAGMTGDQIVERVGPAERPAVSALFAQLRGAAAELRELNQVSMDIADAELRLMERAARPSEREAAHGLYRPDGSKDGPRAAGLTFEEKV